MHTMPERSHVICTLEVCTGSNHDLRKPRLRVSEIQIVHPICMNNLPSHGQVIVTNSRDVLTGSLRASCALAVHLYKLTHPP